MSIQSRSAILRTYGGKVAIECVELDDPIENEVVVRTCACGVCHSDLHYKNGAMPHFPVPSVMGHEAAGVVERVGSAVTSVKPGDHVVACNSIYCGSCKQCLLGRPHLCKNRAAVRRPRGAKPRYTQNGSKILPFSDLGGLSEYMLLHERAVVKIDEDIPLDRAALMGCAVLTGIGAALNTAKIEPGATVAVFGCGGVGSAIIQGARIAGARQIIAVDVVAGKLQSATQFGATDTVDSRSQDPVEAILELTGGGVDYAFDAVGNVGLVATAFDCLAARGLAVMVGAVPAGQKVVIEGRGLLSEKRLTGSFMGSNRFQLDIPYYIELYRQGRLNLDLMVSDRIKLDDVNNAFAAMERGDGVRSVVVF